MASLRIVFMGTPEFAVAFLDAIQNSHHQVAGVVTTSDKPAGRGQKLQESAVKKYALERHIPVLQPLKLKDPDFLQSLQMLHADVFVVVAFRMLPKEVWSIPPRGTINLHGSLLPQYRGAAPINRALMNGERETGMTAFFIDEQIDTGKIVFSEAITITDDENAGMLHDKMKGVGAKLIIKTLDAVSEDDFSTTSQENLFKGTSLKEAPKIFREDCIIDWNKTGRQIFNQIRGLSPYPVAFTTLKCADGSLKTLKVFKANIASGTSVKAKPGEIFLNSGKLFIGAHDGFIELLEVQLEGKRRMKASDFLNGFDISQAAIPPVQAGVSY